MAINLKIVLLIFSIFLLLVTTYILRKGRIPEKYALLWYFISLVILILTFFPGVFSFLSNKLGFQVMSNLIIGIMLVLLIFLTMSLTIIVSGQKKKTTLLIQEISLLKAKINNERK